MLDRKWIAENLELVRENCRLRNSPADVDRFVQLEAKRRTQQAAVEEIQALAGQAQEIMAAEEGLKQRPPKEYILVKAEKLVRMRDLVRISAAATSVKGMKKLYLAVIETN